MNLKAISIFFALLSLGNNSCKRNKDIIVPLSEIAKAYCDFNVGTYWVYQDSLTGETDSVHVIERTERFIGNGEVKKGEIRYRCFSSHKQVSDPNKIGNEAVERRLIVNEFPKNPNDSINTVFFANRYYIHQIYADHFKDVSNLNTGATEVLLIHRHDSITIHSKVYYHVKEFANNQMRALFAKHIGLIQFHRFDNPNIARNWKVVRYHIN